ncbi:ammonium transporter [Alkalibaculum sp. M08DMB]|uniref:Ammonium transporter n=1 Tax=Alkalibaculum sporogenes TaxID=2655001 RepID=A0A6A7KBX7_9FIRM|nr:ammonium transporter [Alkalibaculum sporogenes]MPW26687.1 ammonium transporter [Alkalibaculum sporogenes]
MDLAISIDTIWVLFGATLVFFMQAGFAMVETGFTRSKNVGNIIMKNLMDFSIGSLIFWAVGFSIMYGESIGGFIGKADFFVRGSYDFGIPTAAFLIFQTVFAATAATIVSGAMAERTKFITYCIFSFVISLVIYPIAGHWIWGGGFLSELGFIDFAGSTAVHSVGGWAALVGAMILGPRIGKYGKDGKSKVIPGHSITLGALGVFILWFGWFGFNPGSQLEAAGLENATAISNIFVTTNLSAAAGAVIAMVYTWIKYGKPDVSMTLNGALAGLVGVTAGCAVVSPTGAALIGTITGLVVVASIEFFDHKLKIDDPVGAISVHGICGAIGTLLVGVFALEGGLFYGGGFTQLGIQAIGVLTVAVWTIGTSFILFKVLDKTIGLRVTAEEELEGLDLHEHGIEGYADFQMKTTTIVE